MWKGFMFSVNKLVGENSEFKTSSAQLLPL